MHHLQKAHLAAGVRRQLAKVGHVSCDAVRRHLFYACHPLIRLSALTPLNDCEEPARKIERAELYLRPFHIARARVQHRLDLKRRQFGVLAANQRGDARDMRRGETISRTGDVRAI